MLLLRLPSSQTAPSMTVGRLVAGLEDGGVDRAAVGADRQRARRVAEQRDDGQRGAVERVAEAGGVEDPDQGARRALGGEQRRHRAGTFWPRRAVVMKARLPAGAGEDDVARLVADQQRAGDARRAALTSTMLTLSERWLTTQTSLLVRAATATGSMPTSTEPRGSARRRRPRRSPSRLSGVLTANSRVPSGDSASGRTCPLSNSVKAAPGCGSVAGRRAAPRRSSGRMRGADALLRR